MKPVIPIRGFVLTLLLCSACVGKPPYDGTIARFSDGDTFVVERADGAQVKVRLHYADAPELAHNKRQRDQPGGREALAFAQKKWQGKTVTVTPKGESYGRIVADVEVKDTGEDCALALVSAGWASCDPRYHPPQPLRDAEARAVAHKLGAFAAKEKPTPPWEWRKTLREKHRRGAVK